MTAAQDRKNRRRIRDAGQRGAGLTGAILLALAAAGAVNAAPRPVSSPHSFMSDEARCSECHLTVPVRPGGGFHRDIVTICSDCHFDNHRMSHPVDIRPRRPENLSLPLDSDGSMTCATCHDPHGEPSGTVPYVRRGLLQQLRGTLSSQGYPTYFLRMPNTEGQLCRTCHTEHELGPGLAQLTPSVPAGYAGSQACATCHPDIFRQWSLTPHALTLGDPSRDPKAITAVFTGDENFRRDQVVFSIGTHWNQRYVVKRGEKLMVAKGVWSLEEGKWARSYWREQPWRELCSGCHLTGYDPYRETLTEFGVGCEMCHGPGRIHVATRRGADILNPARLTVEQRDSICASCHTLGHDRTGEFRFPVGYTPGEDLGKYYLGLMARTGQGPDTFKGDGSIEDRLRSYGYWVENFFRHDRFACKLCKTSAPSGLTEEQPDVYKVSHHCLHCHIRLSGTDAYHDFSESEEADCFLCHKPMTDRAGRPSVHDHKFVFLAN